jgi:hypothetical protein
MGKGEGKKVWIFPDGDLPEKDPKSRFEAHEALMVLNTSDREAHLSLSFYFSDKDPVTGVPQSVGPQRVKCIRMDHAEEIGGTRLPLRTQYALKVESDVEIVATFGRLDTASENMAFYSAAWFNR